MPCWEPEEPCFEILHSFVSSRLLVVGELFEFLDGFDVGSAWFAIKLVLRVPDING
jgi:hypothetical protein